MASPIQAIDTELDLDRLNRQFETATPQEILSWCIEHVPEGLVQTSAFSMLAVTHMLYRELQPQPPVPVLFLDTLHHFPETLETLEKAKEFYSLDVHVYRPSGLSSREEFAQRYGERLWERDVERFHYLTKVEPLQRALDELGVKTWITGRRRDQSSNRQNMPIFEQDPRGYLKVNPLARWSRKNIWDYTFYEGALYNPLHDQGYTSIGDEPLTTRVKPGEPERAGRWRGSKKSECGIHTL